MDKVKGARRREVIKENTADAAMLLTTGEIEVPITPRFEVRMICAFMRIADVPPRGMEGARILIEEIIGREVGAPTKPVCTANLEEPNVGTERRYHRRGAVEDERERGRLGAQQGWGVRRAHDAPTPQWRADLIWGMSNEVDLRSA